MKAKILFSLAGLFVLGACTSSQRDRVRNEAVDQISKAGSEVTASVLTCSNPEVIKSDYAEKLSELSVFQTRSEQKALVSAQSDGGDKKALGLICQTVSMAVTPILMGEALDKVPESWGCSGDALNMSAQEFASKWCDKL